MYISISTENSPSWPQDDFQVTLGIIFGFSCEIPELVIFTEHGGSP